MQITKIEVQAKNKKRCNIYLDNSFACGLEMATVVLNNLKVGKEIEHFELTKIQADSERELAFQKALGYISRSIKTKKQVQDYLSKKGFLTATIDYVIEKMIDYKYINDADYSLEFARLSSKSKGKRAISFELIKKGVDKSLIEKAIDTIDSEIEVASKIAEKYLRNKSITRENIQKAYRYLISKGFDFDTAKDAIDKFKLELED